MGIVGIHPAVFVRVANKELQDAENERVWKRLRTKDGCKRVGTLEDRGSWLTITPPTPMFFISVDSRDS
jgi:hypothetical protein